MANRQQRRQGVVYGPVRQDGPRSSAGSVLGRILGLVVLVAATGLLVAGAIAFVGGRNPTPSPRQTVVALNPSLLPSLSPLPTTIPTSAPSPTDDGPSPSASGSNGPGPTPPLIGVGPGFVTFGTKVDRELKINDPRTEFSEDERITWSAYLTEPADPSALRMLVLKSEEAAPGGERLIADELVESSFSPAQIYTRKIRAERLLDGPGIYIVRYLRGERLLAEGLFLVTEG